MLEDRRFERLGGTTSIQVEVRLVAATNRNLREAVAEKRFREDLFFRLAVFPVDIPALRERASDIAQLALHFVDRYSRDLGKPTMTLAPATFEAMAAYDWPGNVRELQNCMERAVLLTDGDVILPAHLNLEGRLVEPSRADPWDALDLSGTLDEASRRVLAEVERRKLGEALAVESGDRQRAAARLGVTPQVLAAKIGQHGLDRQ